MLHLLQMLVASFSDVCTRFFWGCYKSRLGNTTQRLFFWLLELAAPANSRTLRRMKWQQPDSTRRALGQPKHTQQQPEGPHLAFARGRHLQPDSSNRAGAANLGALPPAPRSHHREGDHQVIYRRFKARRRLSRSAGCNTSSFSPDFSKTAIMR